MDSRALSIFDRYGDPFDRSPYNLSPPSKSFWTVAHIGSERGAGMIPGMIDVRQTNAYHNRRANLLARHYDAYAEMRKAQEKTHVWWNPFTWFHQG